MGVFVYEYPHTAELEVPASGAGPSTYASSGGDPSLPTNYSQSATRLATQQPCRGTRSPSHCQEYFGRKQTVIMRGKTLTNESI